MPPGGLGGGGWGPLLIDGLVGTHRAGVRDCMDCSIPLCLIPEIERKAGVHDLRRGVGIVLHIGGKVLEAILGAAVADCAHKHKCPQVLHAGTLVKEDLESIGEAGDGCRTGIRRGRRLRRGRRNLGRRSGGAILNLLNKTINFLEKTVDRLSERLSVFNVLNFPAEKVDDLEQQVEQGGAQRLRDNLHRFVTDNGKQILRPVCDCHQGTVFHHG